ncbi:MAG: SDR family NAD(P)-dependent oxidoreductase, partial [Candidatus Buchananbacteria bacterium]
MKKNGDLEGKVIIVTGGTGVIGLAIVKELLALGVKVVAGSASAGKAAAVGLKLDDFCPQTERLFCRLDVTDEANIGEVIAKTVDRFGQIDGLVNCAGGNRGLKPFFETD